VNEQRKALIARASTKGFSYSMNGLIGDTRFYLSVREVRTGKCLAPIKRSDCLCSNNEFPEGYCEIRTQLKQEQSDKSQY